MIAKDGKDSKGQPEKPLCGYSELLKMLTRLLEYNKTYPEGIHILNELKKRAAVGTKNNVKLDTVLLFMTGLSNFLLFNKGPEKKSKKSSDGGAKQVSSGTFFKQSETFKQVLSNLFTESIPNEKLIKTEICTIFHQLFDYIIDFYLRKNKDYFMKCILNYDFVANIKNGNIKSMNMIRIDMANFIEQNIWELLPPICKTGTSLDWTDEIHKKQSEKCPKNALSIDSILEFSLLPTVTLLFALGGQDNDLEKCAIKIITRIYSLRSEVLDSVKEL